MKAARLESIGSLVMRSIEKPVARSGELLVRVAAAGICGSDRHMFKGEYPTAIPVTMGHEFCGIVEEVGENVTRFTGGELVTVDPNISCGICSGCARGRPNLCESLTAIGVTRDGGFAEYAAVPHQQAFILPADLNPVHGAFCEPLACCIHAIDKAQIRPGDGVAILGGGSDRPAHGATSSPGWGKPGDSDYSAAIETSDRTALGRHARLRPELFRPSRFCSRGHQGRRRRRHRVRRCRRNASKRPEDGAARRHLRAFWGNASGCRGACSAFRPPRKRSRYKARLSQPIYPFARSGNGGETRRWNWTHC